MLNVIGMCRLVNDPELKEVAETCVATARVATNEVRKVGDNFERTPHYFEIKLWDAGAKRFCETASKGDEIYIEGILRQETWKTKENEPRSKDVIRVSKFQVMPRAVKANNEPSQ